METTTRPRTSRFAYLGELLVSQEIITEQQLNVAMREQKRRRERLGTILIESGFCTEYDIASCLAKQLRLEVEKVGVDDVDVEAARMVDESLLRNHCCVPVRADSGRVRLAIADPFDVDAVDSIASATGRPVDLVVATSSDIVKAIDAMSAGICTVDEILADVGADGGATIKDQVSTEDLVTHIIRGGVQQGATDIHIEPDGKVLRVRYRIDGILTQGPMINRELTAPVIARVKVISNLDISETRLPQDGRARVVIDGANFDLRISILPTILGENVVMRILDTRTALLRPQQLGLSEMNYAPVMEFIERPHGILLVTGPTGSGKSTTLYSLLATLNGLEKKIITVEDPVEYRIPMVRQCQVHSEIGMTFAAALRSILRQDPDVILIGEIRDQETAEIAVRSALTGHLVFSTLHTNTSIGAIPRLIDMGIDPFLLKSSLCGVIAQRLVRKICKHCREDYTPTMDEITSFHPELRDEIKTLARGRGCERCRQSGYSGRLAIHEVFRVTDSILGLDLSGVPEDGIRSVAEEQDRFRDVAYDGQVKAIKGLTDMREVLRVTLSH